MSFKASRTAGLTAFMLFLAGCQASMPLVPTGQGFTLTVKADLVGAQRKLLAETSNWTDGDVDHLQITLYRSTDGTHYTDTGAGTHWIDGSEVGVDGQLVNFTNLQHAVHYMAVPEAYTRQDQLINKPQRFDEDGVPLSPGGDALTIAAYMGNDKEYVSGTLTVQLLDRLFDGRATAPGGLNFLPGFKHGYQEAPHFQFDTPTLITGIAGKNYPPQYPSPGVLPADFSEAGGIAYDAYDDSLVIADTGHNRIVRVNPQSGQVRLIAGSADGVPGLVDDYGPDALFNRPTGVAVDPNTGDIYVADTGNHVLRLLDNIGNGFDCHVMAGTAPVVPDDNIGFADGAIGTAKFSSPGQLALDPKGLLYVSDTGNRSIRRVNTGTGTTDTVAGSPTNPAYADGDGVNAGFGAPAGLAIREALGRNNVYVADPDNNCIRLVIDDTNAPTTTFAGDALTAGFQEGALNGGSIPWPLFRRPTGLACGPMFEEGPEYLWINDADNHRIRVVNLDDPTLPVRTFGGTGVPGDADAYALKSLVNGPAALTIKPIQGYGTGGLYFIEFFNARLRNLAPENLG